MKTTMRTLGAAAALTLSLAITGCKDSTTGPDPAPAAPALPKAERLMFPFSDFGDPGKMDPGTLKAEDHTSRLNYFNARVRVAVIQVVTEFLLAPPIAAFALAIHTTPSPQDDGSYIWIYTFVDGDKEAQIRLRGKPEVDHVVWELRVTNLNEVPAIDNELWFEGETTGDGDAGFFRFHDFTRPGKPIVARLEWSEEPGNERLVFTDLYTNVGDSLSYLEKGDHYSIEFYDASDSMTWFIRWNKDGSGSLKAPDYNDAQEACWDQRQNDVVCAAPAL